MQKYDEAIADYMEAIKIDQNNTEAYCYMAIAFLRQQKYDEALSNTNKAIELNPDISKYYDIRCDSYIGVGDIINAQKDAQKGLELAKRDEDTEMINQFEEKIAQIEEALKAQNDNNNK